MQFFNHTFWKFVTGFVGIVVIALLVFLAVNLFVGPDDGSGTRKTAAPEIR